ncbi:MAG: hypothetical protein PHE96_00070 [Methylococcales bacterium]|nr:hypothetical protein [Methylococcales bacterium]
MENTKKKEREKNQNEFREILAQNSLTQAQAAELITVETCRSVSPRAVRAWLSNHTAKTATPCPKWAIMALKRATGKDNKNRLT